MKRKIELLMVLLLLIGAIIASKGLSEYVTSEKVEKGTKTVVLDAGHGSEDPGKIGINNVLEKDVNLKISKKVQKRLIEQGIHVVMTREDDDGFYNESRSNKKIADMKKRVALINETKPDIAVSIHQNSYHEESAGILLYTFQRRGTCCNCHAGGIEGAGYKQQKTGKRKQYILYVKENRSADGHCRMWIFE